MIVLFEPGYLLSLGLVLLLGRLVALVLRRRWGLAEARREEVVRLIRLAAEEADVAEVESSVAAGGTGWSGLSGGTSEPGPRGPAAGGGGGRRCVVCYSPTTTRCARCKSVRYCSGKCQIVHWRQGHKEECCPAHVGHGNGRLRFFGLNEHAEQPELIGNSLEIEGTPFARTVEVILKRSTSSESNYSSEVFSEEDNFQDKPFENSSGTESSSDSSTSSVFSGPIETSEDASTSDFIRRTSPEQSASACLLDTSPVRSGESLSSCSSAFPRTAGEASSCKIEEVEGPSGVGLSGSENFTISSLSTGRHDEIVGIRASHNTKVDKATEKTSQDVDYSGVYVRPTFQMTSKLSGPVKPSLSISREEGSSCKLAPLKAAVMLDSTVTTVPGLYKSDHVSSGRDNHAWILKSKESTCQSSTSYVDHRPLSGGGHSVLSRISSKVDNYLNMPTKPSQNIIYALNGARDLKMSRKVIGQIKASKVSRQYPSGTSSLIPEKHSYKMLFSYDTFVKLYNLDVNLRPFGLTNCGNSCYANAVLQCLAFTRPVTAYLLEGFHMKTCPKKDWCFTCELESLLVKAKQGTSPSSPIRIISHIKKIGRNLDHGREEDAHEFLRYAIDAMHSACLKEAGASEEGRMNEDLTLIELIFGGYLQSKIRCMRCNGKSEQHERMMDLNVEIHGDVRTLGEALTHFITTEILDGGNKYYCNRCKSYERAKKKLRILEAPNVLTITLKRYQSGKFGKLNKAIRFPDCINLAPYMSGKEDKSPVYRLYAVVVHLDIMNSAFSGHYVCYVKSSQGKWYEIDDSVVKPVDLDTVLTKGAYMLLYARSYPRAPNMYGKVLSRDYINTKKSKSAEDVSSHHEENPNARISSTTKACSSSSIEDHSSRDYHYATNGHVNSRLHGMFDERFRNPSVNSSSDNSSLLSCSDVGSWSTESTRNSFSTDDYSEYLFGEPFDII